MNVYTVSSGDNNPNNDAFVFAVTMDAGSSSSMKIYESGGSGVIDYSTRSDYIPTVARGKVLEGRLVELAAGQVNQTGYPDFLSWIPGESISLLSSSDLLSTGTIPTFTNKSSISNNAVVKSQKLIIPEYYDDNWLPSGHLQISDLVVPDDPILDGNPTGLRGFQSRGTDLPFIITNNTEFETTGSFDIYSSVLEGCVFGFTLSKNFSNTYINATGSTQLPERFGVTSSDRQTKGDTLDEWNSIFAINDGCNAGSIFRGGENRDNVFSEEMNNYLNKNWYGNLKTYLWGNVINDSSVSLSSRDPETLKRTISYCFLYFGASDDVLSLGKANYVNPWSYNGVGTQLRWHIGLGAPEPYSKQARYIKRENTFLPTINKYAYLNKVFGLPPRSSYSSNIVNNTKLITFTGSLGDPEGAASPGIGY